MKKIKITESQYRRIITEEEGVSVNPEILNNKSTIVLEMGKKLEKSFRELINDEIMGLSDNILISKLLPIEDVIDNLVELYLGYVPRIMESGFFKCKVDEGSLSKLLKEFLIEVGGILYYYIDDIGYFKSKGLAMTISLTGMDLEKGLREKQGEVHSLMSKIIDKMFFKLPYNYFHSVLKNTVKPYKGTGCKMTKDSKGWWGSYATLNDLNFLPLIHKKIIKKLSF